MRDVSQCHAATQQVCRGWVSFKTHCTADRQRGTSTKHYCYAPHWLPWHPTGKTFPQRGGKEGWRGCTEREERGKVEDGKGREAKRVRSERWTRTRTEEKDPFSFIDILFLVYMLHPHRVKDDNLHNMQETRREIWVIRGEWVENSRQGHKDAVAEQ